MTNNNIQIYSIYNHISLIDLCINYEACYVCSLLFKKTPWYTEQWCSIYLKDTIPTYIIAKRR